MQVEEILKIVAGVWSYNLVKVAVIAGNFLAIIMLVKWFKDRYVYKVPFDKGQIKSEILATIKIISFDAVLMFGLMYVDIFPKKIEGFAPAILTFIGMFIWYEIWFYASHRAMHTKALYWIHKQHHVAKVVNPLTSMSFSYLERFFLLVGAYVIPVSVTRAFGFQMSLYGVLPYFFLNYLFNVYGHSNVEFLKNNFVRKPVGKIINTPTYHALHHARYKGHYGLFTPYLDMMFGTYFKDYEIVHWHSSNGHALKTLGQRFKVDQFNIENEEIKNEEKQIA